MDSSATLDFPRSRHKLHCFQLALSWRYAKNSGIGNGRFQPGQADFHRLANFLAGNLRHGSGFESRIFRKGKFLGKSFHSGQGLRRLGICTAAGSSRIFYQPLAKGVCENLAHRFGCRRNVRDCPFAESGIEPFLPDFRNGRRLLFSQGAQSLSVDAGARHSGNGD